jgi:hypothetical protein
MTQERAPHPYYQGPQRAVIQVERKERGDWIAWNWNTVSWDFKHGPLNAVGEEQNEEIVRQIDMMCAIKGRILL